MDDLVQRLALLSPEKRARLLDQLPPLSFAQQRLWFIDQFEEGTSFFYNMAAAVQLDGPLDYHALTRTFNEIVRRHQTLRTAFISVDGQPVQFIHPECTLPLPVLDLSGLQEEQRAAELRHLRRQEAQRPFDLSRAPLLRLSLVRLSPLAYVELITMHHIVSDGWSIGVLVREVTALYEAYAGGKESPLPELAIQYTDYAAWQRERLQGERLEQELGYWREQLGGELSSLEFPTDRARPAVQSYRGGHVQFALNADLTGALRQLARREGATLFMVLLAAFQTLLQRYSGQEQITVGTPVAGRERQETEGLIGFFVNTIVLRSDLSGNPTFSELLQRVREVTLASYAHQEVPFEKLVEELHPQRSLSHSPLFQVMMVLQSSAAGTLRLPGLTLTPLPADHFAALFDLLLSLTETEEGISASLQYKQDLFDAGTAEQIALHYQTLLAGIVSNPQERISRLPLLSEIEQKQQLEEWNATDPISVDDMQRVLADVLGVIWQELLGCGVLSGSENFFELGGNPSLAAQMIRRVHEVVGVELDQGVLAEHPTLESFAKVLEERLIEDVETMSETILS